MTDSNMLIEKIKSCGFTLEHFAKKIGLTRQGLHKKIYNKSEFKQSEIEKISILLNLDSKQEKDIFFANNVDY